MSGKTCESCGKGPFSPGVLDYCAVCSRDLCDDCIRDEGCCGFIPARSGNSEDNDPDAKPFHDRHSKLDPEDVARRIGIPLKDWPGDCHSIAAALLLHKVVEGKLRYGLWRGPIAKTSHFQGRTVCHHGWVELTPATGGRTADSLACPPCATCGHVEDEHERGFLAACTVEGCGCGDFELPREPKRPARVIDPTRWVFEDTIPYIFDGPDTEGHYDVGGQGMREATMRPYAPVGGEEADRRYALKLPPDAIRQIQRVVLQRGGGTIIADADLGELALPAWGWSWVGNAPVAWLEEHARDIYIAMDGAEHLGAFIPIDSRELVLGDGWYGQREKMTARTATRASRKTKAKKAPPKGKRRPRAR